MFGEMATLTCMVRISKEKVIVYFMIHLNICQFHGLFQIYGPKIKKLTVQMDIKNDQQQISEYVTFIILCWDDQIKNMMDRYVAYMGR
jgi:hypothetical protein